MEFPIVHVGQTIGSCTVTDDGLYWLVECRCQIVSNEVERLYFGGCRIGVLERRGQDFICRRRISKASLPEFSTTGMFSLSPYEIWEGRVLDRPVQGFRDGEDLLFPYRSEEPCPVEELICFFTVRDGFWRLPLQSQWIASEDASCT